MTFKDIFPGLSRTKVIFQDFPGHGIFKKKYRTFQDAWEPCKQPAVPKTVSTSCVGGRHNMPRPLQVDLQPFDLESGVRVTCDVGYLGANLVFPGLSVLDLGPMYVTDRRQTRIID